MTSCRRARWPYAYRLSAQTGRLALGNSSLSWAQFAYSAWARILFHFDQKITRPGPLLAFHLALEAAQRRPAPDDS